MDIEMLGAGMGKQYRQQRFIDSIIRSTAQRCVELAYSMKYKWDKPVGEMPMDWYVHNNALNSFIESITKEFNLGVGK